MQHSKSLGSFASGSTVPLPGQRPRARSSLDTFVIPGRTRIPSTKPQPIDIQIVETLLNPTMASPMRRPSNEILSFQWRNDAEAKRLVDTLGIQHTSSRQSSDQNHDKGREHQTSKASFQGSQSNSSYTLQEPVQTLYKVRPEISKRPPPQIGGRDVIIVPPRRPRKVLGNAPPKRLTPPPRKVVAPRDQRRGVYDGAIGSSYESRTTSMTWSTVSQRVFTDSSANSQGLGASESLAEFNRLAVQHGLPELERCPGDKFKATEKIHHHNWLARKFFGRSSSTYTLKVKSAQKPVKRKKSFGGIPKMDDPSQRNILKDNSLEEICRLGGMGALILPEGFGIKKHFSLPTCLSTTATYLIQHGTNSPGLFRVSGQSSTVNALHEYYAHQFAQAGSPSKVQETVGSGLLPTHIEHSVADVASLFKKILNALPGGLLGSLELFEAFRSIFFQLPSDPDHSDPNTKMLQSKLIALAISSVASTKRASLIQAVIGLVAYFGDEAEKIRRTIAATALDISGETQPPSELMGFQSLGVVMGPLMLGDLIDQVDLCPVPETENSSRVSMDSAKKGDKKTEKKQKRTSFTSKVDRDATLSAHVDRANLTANIMELLLIIWKDVVVQLRGLRRESSSNSLHNANQQLKSNKIGFDSRHHLGTSEEEMLLMNLIRGRPLPANFSGEFKMKKKIKVDRSPMGRRARKTSSFTPESPTTIASGGEIPAKAGRSLNVAPDAATTTTKEAVRAIDDSGPGSAGSSGSNTLEKDRLEEGNRTKSDIAMDQMSMGTILPRLQDSPVTPLYQEMLHPVSQSQSPKIDPQTPTLDLSSIEAPETALRDVTKPDLDGQKIMKRSNSSLDKPLPPIGAAQRAEILIQKSDEDNEGDGPNREFPTRTSSLAKEETMQEQRSLGPLELTKAMLEPDLNMKPRRRASTTPSSRKDSQERVNHDTNGGSKLLQRSKRGSVKILTQRFNGDPSSASSVGSTNSNIPKIYATIYTLPPENTALHNDPFLSCKDTSPEKVTRIPKPAQDVGSIRRAHSRSPSPPKSPNYPSSPAKRSTPKSLLKKRPSVFNIVPDYDADTVKANGVTSPETIETHESLRPPERESDVRLIGEVKFVASQLTELKHHQDALDEILAPQSSPSQPLPPLRTISNSNDARSESGNSPPGVAPRRRPSAYADESKRRVHLSNEAKYIPTHVVSADIDPKEPSNTKAIADQPKCEGPKRNESVNNAMAAEIRRLNHFLDRRDRDVREMRRTLETLKDAQEDGITASGSKACGSFSKATLINELRLLRKETVEWKKRAEWAESRLAVLEGRRKPEVGNSSIKAHRGSSSRGASSGNGNGKPHDWLHE